MIAILGRNVARGGATRTLHHGQGFDRGAVADRHDWHIGRPVIVFALACAFGWLLFRRLCPGGG